MEKVSVTDHLVYDEVRNNLSERPFLMLFEYIPSLSLLELGPNRAQLLFKERHAQSRKLFIEFGRIIAYDVFINNSDR